MAATIFSILVTIFFMFCAWQISKRFGRSPAWALLYLVPLVGPTVYWGILASTKILIPNEEKPDVK